MVCLCLLLAMSQLLPLMSPAMIRASHFNVLTEHRLLIPRKLFVVSSPCPFPASKQSTGISGITGKGLMEEFVSSSPFQHSVASIGTLVPVYDGPIPWLSGAMASAWESDPLVRILYALAVHYTAAWAPIEEDQTGLFSGPRYTAEVRRHLQLTTGFLSCGAIVRIIGQDVYVRQPVSDVPYWFRLKRLQDSLRLLHFALEKYSDQIGDLRIEFMLNVCDHPIIMESALGTRLGIPVFSPSSAMTHLDIPVPDFLDQATGYYPKQEEISAFTPWSSRKNKAVFVGAPHSYDATASNYNAHARLRLRTLSHAHQDEVHARFNKFNGLDRTMRERMNAAGMPTDDPLTGVQKAEFKYSVIAAGQVHSASLCGVFASGQVAIAHDMAFGEYFFPALVPGKTFIPVHRWFDNLVQTVQFLQQHDTEAEQVAMAGKAFGEMFCRTETRALYWAVLLRHFQSMTAERHKILAPSILCKVGLVVENPLELVGEVPACSDLSPEDLVKYEEQGKKSCHHWCRPAAVSKDESDWYWIQSQANDYD